MRLLQLQQVVELKYKRHGSVKVGDQLGHVESSSYILTDRSTEIKRHSIVPVRLICLTLFYFKKHKQDQPLKFIKDK